MGVGVGGWDFENVEQPTTKGISIRIIKNLFLHMSLPPYCIMI
jgi:hypothetical protein